MAHQHPSANTGNASENADISHTNAKGDSKDNQKPFKDPVCGMDTNDKISLEHAGQTHYFCSARCKEKFSAAPEKYLAPNSNTAKAPVMATMAGTIYICPMHPQIRQPGPGICPICGMALEPEMPDRKSVV